MIQCSGRRVSRPVPNQELRVSNPSTNALSAHALPLKREIRIMRRVNEINNEHIIRIVDAYYDADTTTIVVSKLGQEVFTRLTKPKDEGIT